ncbi:uncharacterized protein DS421_7g211590 [Arachis hypogaea]|nr:uncharacterized protein DS421_7g211590 [Arachis hypogaea]
MKAWNRLRDIFQDNKHSHAITLEYDFTHVYMTNFLNVSTYCQHLKSLSDQLKNVGSLVDNNRLILQLVFGLADPYKEVGLGKKAAHNSSSAIVAHYSNGSHDIPDHASSNHNIMVERGTKTAVIMEGKIAVTMVVMEVKRGN